MDGDHRRGTSRCLSGCDRVRFRPEGTNVQRALRTTRAGIILTKQHIENALNRKRLGIVSERELVLWATMVLLNDAYEIDSADEDLIAEWLNDISFELDPAMDDER
jgi:hypothetical protein